MIEFTDFVYRTCFAGLCGLAVGLDREIKNKPLGARAYILVAMGSAALMTVTLNFSMSSMANDGDLTIDPTRLIQGIVGGIGFLGAGAIMSGDDSGRLRGVGSGAAIWCAGAIGVASGLAYFAEAAFVAGLVFAVLNLHDLFLSLVKHSRKGSDNGADAGDGKSQAPAATSSNQRDC